MLKQRILTALVGLPVLLYVLTTGSKLLLGAFFAVFIGLSVFEISAMILPRMELLFLSKNPDLHKADRLRSFDIVLTLLLGFIIFFSFVLLPLKLSAGVTVAGFMASILIGTLLAKDNDTAMGHAMGYVFSL